MSSVELPGSFTYLGPRAREVIGEPDASQIEEAVSEGLELVMRACNAHGVTDPGELPQDVQDRLVGELEEISEGPKLGEFYD